MKTGSHNLGPNAFAQVTIAKLEPGALIIRQLRGDHTQMITLSSDQIALLKDVLA